MLDEIGPIPVQSEYNCSSEWPSPHRECSLMLVSEAIQQRRLRASEIYPGHAYGACLNAIARVCTCPYNQCVDNLPAEAPNASLIHYDDNTFNLDYSHPLCGMQALAIALTTSNWS